jgi:tRNA modification GTPase
VLAINKLDNYKPERLFDYYALGLGEPFGISCEQSTGIGDLLDEVCSHLEKIEEEESTEEVTKIAVVGKPNAGKSSLYNMLLGQECAIVTDIAGTTRDIIEHTASVGGVTLCLADTAGIRESTDTVEKIGIERAKEKIDNSELLLCVFDQSEQENDEDEFILECAKDKCAIALINKIDTPPRISEKFLEKIKSTCQKTIYISAKNRDGYDELSSTIKELYELGDIDLSNDAVVSNARQFSSVSLALDGAYEAKDALLFGQTPDIVLFALEKALSSLDMIDARTTGEEIVNAIFSRFCVGK